MLVLPFDVAAVFGDGAAEQVGFFVAVIVDVTGAEIPAEGGVAVGGFRGAVIAAGGAEHETAGRIDPEVAAEAQPCGHGQMHAGFSKGAERSAVAAVERGEGGGERLLEVLLETREGQGLHMADAGLGVFGAEPLTGGVDDFVGAEGGLPGTGLAVGDGGAVERDLLHRTRGGLALGIVGMGAEADVFGGESLGSTVEDEFVGEEAHGTAGEDHVAGAGDGFGGGIVANLVGRDEQGAIGHAGVATEHGLVGLAIEIREVGFQIHRAVLSAHEGGREGEKGEEDEPANHARSKGGAVGASKPWRGPTGCLRIWRGFGFCGGESPPSSARRQ